MKRLTLLSVLLTVSSLLAAACQPVSISTGSPLPLPTQQPATTSQTILPIPSDTPAPTAEPSPADTESPTLTTGSIRGSLGYPSEVVPELLIVAFLYGSDTFYTLETGLNQTSFQLEGLPQGSYHVVAYTQGGGNFPAGLSGGYTQAAACGMQEGCTDHSLVDVRVIGGQVVEEVNIIDWLIPLPPMPQEGQPAQGAITGQLSYPSEFIPPMRVVATRVDDNQTFFVNTQINEETYVLTLPAGTYHVVAYVGGVDANATSMAAGYSQAVLCGLTVECSDHNLIDVVVQQGSVIGAVNPGDFYAPEGTFPPLP